MKLGEYKQQVAEKIQLFTGCDQLSAKEIMNERSSLVENSFDQCLSVETTADMVIDVYN